MGSEKEWFMLNGPNLSVDFLMAREITKSSEGASTCII